MASAGIKPLREFTSDPTTCAQEWQFYKRDFLIHIDALGLQDKPGRRKVAILLNNMGREAVKIYDSFTWVNDDEKYDLEGVFTKFDQHFGVHSLRNVKRQEFLNSKRGNMTVMDFIATLKRKAEYCQYGEEKEGFICDMIINGVNDSKLSEKLMEIPPAELTLNKVIEVCRQVELTATHLKSLGDENPNVNTVHTRRPQAHVSHDRKMIKQCVYCRRTHEIRKCPAYNKYCDNCGRKGHFKNSDMCNQRNRERWPSSRGRGSYRGRGSERGNSRDRRFFRGSRSDSASHGQSARSRVHYAEDASKEYAESSYEENVNDMCEEFEQNCSLTGSDVFTVKNNSENNSNWSANLNVKGKKLMVQLDTGAHCNVISRATAETFRNVAKVKPSDMVITGINGNPTKAYGQITLPCSYNKSPRRDVVFQVLDTNRNVNLLGGEDCVNFKMISRINSVHVTTDEILDRYKDVINNEIGCMPTEYEIKINPEYTPVVHPPRSLPVAMREQVKKELDNLTKWKIITPVEEPTDWVSSMVCVRKKNGRVRICIDPADLNKAILREHYPINSIDDIVTRVNGSKYFSTLDANKGYFQIKLTEKSSFLTTFNTPFGRFRYLRLPMGIKCASEIFQREMNTHFGNLEGVEIMMDDILVHGKSIEEHNARLCKLLEKARAINLKLNKEKCVFAKTEVDYVGHTLTGEGLKPTQKRIDAIINMRDPENHEELKTVLGMLEYVGKFIPRLSQLNAPLRELKKREEWSWDAPEKQAFANIKEALTSTKVLRYYDVNKPLRLTVDASTKGLGAAVIQNDGVVAYASRALSPAEQRYAQIEKEMLAVVYGCEKFHKLIYGKSDITIESDHKPLENIMRKPIVSAPMRIQRMMLKLQPYQFELKYVSGKEIGLADCLSRLPLNGNVENSMDDEMMIFNADIHASELSAKFDNIVEATQQDVNLQILKQVICEGWPERKSQVPLAASQYWDFRDQMSVHNGIVFRGERTVIPFELRPEILKIIHSSHMGIVKCKQRARELVFWPGMNKQIEEV
ncbi:uncharacterized protein K02A2.6, partial [Lingula anatina]|uniref:Uncharacterized protein K02A2.6 n=1 Tax=Lingula anatina TaxID=7574 RepID=A0A1S3J188_LINAN